MKMPQALKNAADPELENPAAQTLCEPAGRVPGARARTLIQPHPSVGTSVGGKTGLDISLFRKAQEGRQHAF